MEQIIIRTGGQKKTIMFRADVPTMIKPLIRETVTEEGERFYICSQGKKYIASVFDHVFGVLKGKILAKNFRLDIVKIRNGNNTRV